MAKGRQSTLERDNVEMLIFGVTVVLYIRKWLQNIQSYIPQRPDDQNIIKNNTDNIVYLVNRFTLLKYLKEHTLVSSQHQETPLVQLR